MVVGPRVVVAGRGVVVAGRGVVGGLQRGFPGKHSSLTLTLIGGGFVVSTGGR